MAANNEAGPSSAAMGSGSRTFTTDPEELAAKLMDGKTDAQSKAATAQELKEGLEAYHQGQNNLAHYIKHMVPAALYILHHVPCSMQSDASEQRTRLAILETLHRLPQFEPAKALAKDLMKTMVNVVREDNEENAVVAIKVIIDLHRHLKSELENEVAPFLQLVGDLYRNFKKTVASTFEKERAESGAGHGSDNLVEVPSPAADSQSASIAGSDAGMALGASIQPRTLAKSFSSFKVLTECPIATVFILQTYKNNVPQAISLFLPLTIEECLMQEAKPQKEAHEAAKAKNENFVGVAPGIKDRALFTEMVVAQVKTMSFLAYVIKGSTVHMRPYAQVVPGIAVRLLQDCPPEASATRKELLVAIRHVFTTDLRGNFVDQIDTLLDPRVFLGTGITTRETLRPLAISMLADLVHHIRNELTYKQLVEVIHRHCEMLHDSTLAPSIMTMCTKLLTNLVETITTRHAEGAPQLLRGIFDSLVEKLAGLPRLREDFETMKMHKKMPNRRYKDIVTIERGKIVQVNVMVPDFGSESFKDSRFLLRNVLTSIKSLMTRIKSIGAPEPDSEIMSRLFIDGIKSWSLYEQNEQLQDKEGMETFVNIFVDIEPQTFHEVMTVNMPFLFDRMLNSVMLLGIPQTLLSNEVTSRRYVAILLQYLVDHLSELGNADKKHASVSLRLFKMAFMAVTILPDVNEVVLQPHLSHIIMTSMKLSSRAIEPANYFLLLRALFRSIGGGRFELLYKDVLPLLPVILENLNAFLNAAESSRRELFVDLCLTVPVRLSVLLPYLGYLMRPLILALESSTDLVSQGLRTLELCIDNLTQEFLDPIMAPYIYDIMSALWKHLQPLPHNHQHSHTTMRILGKLGGRNRRLLQAAPHLDYIQTTKQPSVTIHFEGKGQSIALVPILDLALTNIRRGDEHYRKNSFELLRHAATLLLDGILNNENTRERDGHFERVIKGLFDAIRVDELQESATNFLSSLARHVISLEAKQDNHSRQFSPLTLSFFDGIVGALGSIDNETSDLQAIVDLELEMVASFRNVCSQASKPELFSALIHSLASKHCNLCYDQLWQKKTGGWMGIDMLIRKCDLGKVWMRDHQLEIVRALLYMLKDMPNEPPRNVDDVSNTLLLVLETVNSITKSKNVEADALKEEVSETPEDKVVQERQFSFLVGVLLSELSSTNSHVRVTARLSFEKLAELKGVGVTDILLPMKERLLTPIFQKPLRALPFGMQIGHIDAITFTLQLKPPLPDFNDELFRVLTETLALADAEDQALIGRPSTSQYKNMVAVTQLRVVSLKCLASAMACPDFDAQGSRLNSMRHRIIGTYFKTLYSKSGIVIDTAFDCLRETLLANPKLPKDVLQGGLRPVLMTLAEASRLTISGLHSLAKLLELLTSYFKVEIGTKLLAHMQVIAQPSIIEKASRGSLQGPIYADAHQMLQPRQQPRDSEPIETLAAIVNIFHLLPSAASGFMDRLVAIVCDIETIIKRTGQTPFAKPLGLYINKFPKQGVELFFQHLDNGAYQSCLRRIIASRETPNVVEYLTKEGEQLFLPIFSKQTDLDLNKIRAALHVIQELTLLQSDWLIKNRNVLDSLLSLWNTPAFAIARQAEDGPREERASIVMAELLCGYLEQSKEDNVEIFFSLLQLFTLPTSVDMTNILRTIYTRLAIHGSTSLKRDVIRKFIDIFEDVGASQAYKAECLRVLVNPILICCSKGTDEDKKGEEGNVEMDNAEGERRGEEKEPLFDAELIGLIVRRIWKAFSSPNSPLHLCSDDVVRVELLHMSTMILEQCADLISGTASKEGTRRGDDSPRKDAIKFGWANLTAEDITIKNSAYIFLARFLELFESPAKIVTQVYLGLLRSNQPEGRIMVRKALDILVPALPKRMPVEVGKVPDWVKATKRQLINEGHNLPQLFSILQLLIRHCDLFYSSRDLFMTHIASNLAKLGLSGSATAETRHLAVEAVELVFKWEKHRVQSMQEMEAAKMESETKLNLEKGESSKKRSEEGTTEMGTRKRARLDRGGSSVANSNGTVNDSNVASSTQEHAYSCPLNIREAILSFLLRFVSLSTDSMARGTVSKAYLLLKEILSTAGWQEIPIKLAIFQRPLTMTDMKEQHLAMISNSLQALKLVIKDKNEQWVMAHLPQLHKLLEKPAQSDEPIVLENCRSILDKIFEVLPLPEVDDEGNQGDEMDQDAKGEEEDTSMMDDKSKEVENKSTRTEDDAGSFRLFAENIITEGLKNSSSLYGALVMLTSWSKSHPEIIDVHLPAITKALTRLTKEHIAATRSIPITEPSFKMLLMDLDLLKMRISHLGEQRRWFLSAVVQLVERTNTLELCRYLLSMMSKWILEQKETFPTIKEKAGILIKMMTFESRDDVLFKDYLDLILSIYTTGSYSRTELTVRLENAFLVGCRHRDYSIQIKFITIFDQTFTRVVSSRLQYLLGTQSWESFAEYYWIQQALDLLLGSIDVERLTMGTHPGLVASSKLGDVEFSQTARSLTIGSFITALRAMIYADNKAASQIWISLFGAAWRVMSRKHQEEVTRSLIGVLTKEYNLRQVSKRPNVVQSLLVGALNCKPLVELPPHVVKYLGKTFNVWHASIEMLQMQLINLPREDDSIREATQDALAELYAELSEDDVFYGLWRRRVVFAESNAAISYEQNGMWSQAQVMYESAQIKARSAAITFTDAEYNLWEDHWVLCAQNLQQWDILTDLAKLEGNHDLLLECAWRLSDWVTERDILEQALDSLSATTTPRRRVFAAYMALLKSQHHHITSNNQDRPSPFGQICDEAIQLTLKKWHSLPLNVTQAHVPLLQVFQQFVELQEASTIFESLAQTTSGNLDQRSQELKTLMQTWRERLPNLWDDINAWSDLVAWRQHVFGAVNKAYLPLVPQMHPNGNSNGNNGGSGNSSTNSFAYRGYHETAWIINRFAHVARKHYLSDVCISSLTKIYTLPNIEIQEAFLKLREQAKCHYQNSNELANGLDVINNTNLMFFAAPQKAEFFTLKGMFMARLGLSEEANRAFATAIQMDMNLAKAWTEWGRFNDRIFRDKPNEIVSASSAISCYLQAAGLYKNSKTRKVLIRVLWLLGCDDKQGTISSSFENFRGEAPTWYWITFIPQLVQALSSTREAKHARKLLMAIAKQFPQSLYFHLRTARDDFVPQKRAAMYTAQRAAQAQAQAQAQKQAQAEEEAAKKEEEKQEKSKEGEGGDTKMNDDETMKKDAATAGASLMEGNSESKGGEKEEEEGKKERESTGPPQEAGTNANANANGATLESNPQQNETQQGMMNDMPRSGEAATNVVAAAAAAAAAEVVRQPWEYVDEILNILKTAFPLLALTMENMAEQIQQRFKPTNDEDIYRLTNALLNDALQQYIQRASMPNDNGQLPQISMANVARFADNLPQGQLRSSFEEDFVKSKPTLRDYVHKLQRWRDRYEAVLDKRPARQHLEHCSHYLVEFQHQRFDEVEVPGQYLKLEDNNSDFVKISRFLPTFDVVRSAGMCTRRLSFLSNKGSTHSFSVQLPSGRYCRREERIFMLLRLFNRILERRTETRKRGLVFSTPFTIPLSPQLRLIENNASIVSLQDIYEKHCQDVGIGKEDPIIAWVEKMKSTWTSAGALGGMVEISNLRMDLLDEISTKMVPETVLSTYLTKSMATPSDLWLMRKHFTLQMASNMFLTYVLFISARLPNRIHISRSNGNVSMSDVVPSFHPQAPQFKSPDATPFRLTPNIQHFIGPIGIEGILTSSLVAIGRCLSEPDRQMEEYLSTFVRDEVATWMQTAQRQQQQQQQQGGSGGGSSAAAANVPLPALNAPPAREIVMQNILEVVKRARLMSCKHEIEKSSPSAMPVSQTVIDLINSSSSPSKLALQDVSWMPFL